MFSLTNIFYDDLFKDGVEKNQLTIEQLRQT